MARASAVLSGAGRRSHAQRFVLPERAARLVNEANWIALTALALFLFLILVTYDKADPGWSHAAASKVVHNAGGRLGAWMADLMLYMFGLSAYLWIVLCLGVVLRGYQRLRADAKPVADEDQRFHWERWLGFALLFCGCVAMESSRLHSLTMSLPLAPGGILGQVIAVPTLSVLGDVGGTLLLLVMTAAGFSLFTGLSWLTIFENIGTWLENGWQRLSLRVNARTDRKIGSLAAVVRQEQVQELRKILDVAPEPVRIEKPVVKIERSERAQAERQVALFTDLPPDTQLPALSLLDIPPPVQETVSPETLEYTSRLIEKKLADFNVAANVVAAYPGPVITRYESSRPPASRAARSSTWPRTWRVRCRWCRSAWSRPFPART